MARQQDRQRGHIKRRGPNRWAIVISVRDPNTGERKRRWSTYVGTKTGANDERTRLAREAQEGRVLANAHDTIATFGERWLIALEDEVGARTWQGHEGYWRRDIVPELGAIRLDRLTAARIEQFRGKLLREGRKCGEGGLHPQTVRHIMRTLSKALTRAKKLKLIPINPALDVELPRVPRRKVTTATFTDTVDSLEKLRGHRMFVPVMIASMGGLRLSEVLALQWSAIDFDTGVLRVVAAIEDTVKHGARLKAPKTDKSRAVEMPGLLAEELRRHRREQAQTLLAIGIRQTDDTFVVPNSEGKMQRPTSLASTWSKVRRQFSALTMHGYRHSAATQALSAGVPLKVVSEKLGHASIKITADVYQHVSETMQKEAASLIDAAMRAAMERRRR